MPFMRPSFLQLQLNILWTELRVFFFWVCVHCVFHHIKYVGVHSQWEKKYVQGLSDSLVVMTFFVVQTLSPLPHYWTLNNLFHLCSIAAEKLKTENQK